MFLKFRNALWVCKHINLQKISNSYCPWCPGHNGSGVYKFGLVITQNCSEPFGSLEWTDPDTSASTVMPCIIIETLVLYWISRSYLSGVTTAELWWHLSIMNMIQSIWQVHVENWKKKSIEEINEQSFSTSHPRSALSTQRVLDHTVLQIWLHIGSGMECYFWLNQHIEAKTKWPPFLRRYFKYIFLNENIWILIDISLKFIPKGRINNIPALVQIMAWRQLGANDGKFTDAYMRHSASMS